ncbi:hypothetical protein ACWIG3_04865 [Streptomyces celluloflavus]
MHVPLAAALMVDPTLATHEECQVPVEPAGHCRGATLVEIL